jgi:hypothetical protein
MVMTTPSSAWPFPTGIPVSMTQAAVTAALSQAVVAAATSKTRKSWSAADLEVLAKMYVAGKPTSAISTTLGRSVKAITNQLSDMKGKKTPTGRLLFKLVEKNSTPKAISVPKPVNHRAAWDAAADNTLLTAYISGKTPTQIATACGRTTSSIAGRLHALGFLIFDKDTFTYSTAPKVWLKVAP